MDKNIIVAYPIVQSSWNSTLVSLISLAENTKHSLKVFLVYSENLSNEVINSFNKGTFEDKYLNAFAQGNNINLAMTNSHNDINLSKLENDVSKIRKQNETKYYIMPDGTIIMQYKNVKRIIKN